MKFQGVEIEAELGGKLFAVAWLVQGLLLTQSTKQQCGLYGWGVDNVALFLMEEIGTAILAFGVIGCATQFYGTTAKEAIGYTGLVWLTIITKWFLNPQPISKDRIAVLFSTALLLVYAGFNETEWAETALLSVSVTFALICLLGIVLPTTYAKIWNINANATKKTPYLIRHMNVFFLAYALEKILLLRGLEPHKAVGYACLVGLAFFHDGYFGSKGIVKILEKPKPAYIFWIIYFTILCPFTLLFPKADVKEE